MKDQYENVLAPKVLESIDKGAPRDALSLLLAGESSYKDNHNFHFDFGQALQASGEVERAHQQYQLAHSAASNSIQRFRAQFKIALKMFIDERPEEGKAALDKAFLEPHPSQILIRDLEQNKAFSSYVYSQMLAGYQKTAFSEMYLLVLAISAFYSNGRNCAELVLEAAESCDPDKLSEIGEVRRQLFELMRDSEKHFSSAVGYLAENICDPMRHYTLGQSYVIKEKYEEALECFKTALALSPTDHRFLVAAGSAAAQAHNHDDAQKYFGRYLKFKPGNLAAEAAYLFSKRFNAEWDIVAEDSILERAANCSASVTPFLALAFQRDPKVFRKNIENFASESGLNSFSDHVHFPHRKDGSPLRIGFFGSDYHSHATMILAADLLERSPPDGVEVLNFSYGKRKDAYTLKCMESSNEFIDCSELNVREIVSLARSKALDIAIDLKGHTADNRLRIFSARVAPIQVSFLGFPGTTGVSNIDYFIADEVTVPDGRDEEFSEKVIRLPVCYQPGSTEIKFSLESRKKIRSQLGISDCQFLYCNFNTSYKISPSDICLWSEILKKVDGSLFWYMPVTDRAHKGIVGEFLKNGVDPQRILRAAKVPWENHMERLSAADCFLDTEVISAHTTARDALTAGLPVVTHAGNSFAGRVGSSVGRSFGLFQSSGLSRERYVEVACDTMKLHALSEFLRSQENHSLGDGSDFSRVFYSAMKELSSRSSSNHDG